MSAEIRRLPDDWRRLAESDEGRQAPSGYWLRRCAQQLEAALNAAAPAVPAPQPQENKDDLSRVDRSALSDRQDLPRKPQPDGSQRLRHAHRETLEVFKHIEGTVSPQEAARQAANYMLEVLLAAAEVAGVD